jgi:hypothetical protein
VSPVQFQAQIENGTIVFPEAWRQQIADGTTVNVILLRAPPSSWQTFSQEFHQELAASGYDSREKFWLWFRKSNRK